MDSSWQSFVLLFFVMSVIGWTMEVICKFVEFRRFINRGFLIGPYCPIYGVGSVLIILMLEPYASSPVFVFVMALFICGALEYLTSCVMEKLFHARWWDYSHRRFNIDGRVCAGTLIPFGILGLGLIYVIKPVLFDCFARIPSPVLTPLCIALLLMLTTDILISTSVLSRIRQSANLAGGDDTETLTRAIRDTLGKQNLLLRRILRAFPYARIYNNRLLAQFRTSRQRLMLEASARKQRLQAEWKRWDPKGRVGTQERKRKKME